MILAQTSAAQENGAGLSKAFDHLWRLEFPTRAEFFDGLQGQATLVAVGLILAGALFLLVGFKYVKAMVVVNGAAMGALVGAYIGSFRPSPNMPMLLGVAGAVLLGILAWPTIKYAVGVMGALAGGLAGFALWLVAANALSSESLIRHAWAGGIIGMILVGMLAFVAVRPAVMIFTAIQGGMMIVSGFCSLLLAHSGVRESIRPELVENDFLLTVLVGVPAVVGFAVQFTMENGKLRKKRQKVENPPV